MKVLLYTEGLKAISKSGLGKAILHQKKALEDNKIDYTTNLKDDYDLLHINFYGPKSYFYAKKAKRNGKKIVYHAHSTEEDFRNSFLFSNLVSPLFKKWLISCYQLGDYIITPTEYSKRLLLNYNMDRPIKAISNGVDTKFFERNEEAGLEFRKKYGYQKKDKVIVGIGLYIKRKGILDFVELAKRLPQYKFIWFGYSPLWASPREIKKAVQTKLPNLHFAGYVEPDIIKSALSGADLYLFPTLEETEGIPIIEALTAKIPTLIRDIPVFEEYEENKVVYKAKDLNDFEKKIKQILEHKLPNLTEFGYKVAKRKDVKTVGKELIKTYEEVLKMPKNEEKLKQEKEKRTKKIVLGSFVVIALSLMTILLFLSREKPLLKYTKTIESMDTPIQLTVYSNSEKKANKALTEVEKIYQYYEKLTSRDKESKLYEIHHNTSSDDSLLLEEDLYQIIRYGYYWHEKSNGKININLGNASDLWREYKDKKEVPSAKEVDAIKDTDINQIVLLGKNKIENNHPNIDLDNLKLGYATEKAVEYLKKEGLNSYLINASSIIAVGDYYEKEGKYVLAIASPFKDKEDEILTTVQLTNGVIVTKSIYQNGYEYDGKTYANILNPETNRPADNMISVTVVSKNIVDAEALATTLFIMTVPDGSEFIKSFSNVKVMWSYLTDDGEEKNMTTENFYKE